MTGGTQRRSGLTMALLALFLSSCGSGTELDLGAPEDVSLASEGLAGVPTCKLGVIFDGDQAARESYLGMSATKSVNRIYEPWSNTSVGAAVIADLQAGRDEILSLTAPTSSWTAIASGSYDAKLAGTTAAVTPRCPRASGAPSGCSMPPRG